MQTKGDATRIEAGDGEPTPGLALSPELSQGFLGDFRTLDATLDRGVAEVHGFLRNYLKLRTLPVADAESMLRAMMRRAREIVETQLGLPKPTATAPRIPRRMHRIWLTDSDAPCEPPRLYVDNLAKEAAEYVPFGWRHMLWVLRPDRLPETTALLQSRGGIVEVKEIDSDLGSGRWRLPFDRFVADRKYPFAADILRMKILSEYGGFYADMGARFRQQESAAFIADNFDCALILWETMFFQNSLVAVNKCSELIRVFLRIVDNPETIPLGLLGELTGLTEGMTYSGLMLTAILLSKSDESFLVCPLAPNGEIVEWASEKSWYTDMGNNMGKHGNVYVPSSGVSFLTEGIIGKLPSDPIFRRTPVIPDVHPLDAELRS